MTLPDWKTAPPDFSRWVMTKRQSIFFAPKRKYFLRMPFHESHDSRANWLGYIAIYDDAKGVLSGQNFIFFGEHLILKFWGLKGVENYSYFAVRHSGEWKTFDMKFYAAAVNAIAIEDRPNLMVACRISVKDLKNKAAVLETAIKRDINKSALN